jgi:hypothetical protein
MANKQRGYVSIQLDKARNLRFTTNALAELEDMLGHPVTKMDQDNVGIKTLRAMLWAALLDESPDLTIQEAGCLMDQGDMQEISASVSEALELAFGNNDNAKNKVSGPIGVGAS